MAPALCGITAMAGRVPEIGAILLSQATNYLAKGIKT